MEFYTDLMGTDGGKKKGLKERFTGWYENSKDGYFADYFDGFFFGFDGPMSWGEMLYRGMKYGEGLDSYEPASNGLKRHKAFKNRHKGEYSLKKSAKRNIAHMAGQATGWIGGSFTGGISYAANGAMNGIRMLKRKIKGEDI